MEPRTTIKDLACKEFEKAVIAPQDYTNERDQNGLYVQEGLQAKWRMYCQGYTDATEQQVTALHVLAEIREACQDRGIRMQDELVDYIREITNKAEQWDKHHIHRPVTAIPGPAEIAVGTMVMRVRAHEVGELRVVDAKAWAMVENHFPDAGKMVPAGNVAQIGNNTDKTCNYPDFRCPFDKGQDDPCLKNLPLKPQVVR